MNIESAHRKSQMTLTDGRILAWQEWGPLTGKPILFCTGAGMSGSLGFGADLLGKYDARLISVDRPGFGNSSPHNRKSLKTWCNDIKELIAHLQLPKPYCVGFSQGAVFAYALAADNITKATSIVSGQDDFNFPASFELLPEPVQNFFGMLRQRDPGFIQQFTNQVDAQGFFNLIVSMSSKVDADLYQHEPFKSAYLQSLQEGFKHGGESYVQDLLNCVSPWGYEIENISSHVELWYGALDQSAVHSPDFGLRLSKRLPNCERYLLEDQGGSLLWTCSDQILEKLLLN